MTIDVVFNVFPTLTTERLTLRKFTSDDVDATFKLYNNPAVTRFIDIDIFSKREEAEELVDFFIKRYEEDKFSIRWAITLREQQEVIGTCGFNYFDHESEWSEIGYDLSSAYWGKGIMTEALKAILNFGFVEAGLHRIEANVTVGNNASIRLLERLKFTREGVLRERLRVKDQHLGVIYYGLLRSEHQQ